MRVGLRLLRWGAAFAAVSLVAWGLLGANAGFMAGGEGNERYRPAWAEEETAPDEWMLAQRLSGGPIPAGALEAAALQAEVLGAQAMRVDARRARIKWQLVGPTNIGGRITDVVVDPLADDTIYVAAATGGVWKSTDAGDTFEKAWRRYQAQSMGALAITPEGTLFAGTGESNPGGGSLSYGGRGVYRSTNGGQVWRRVGLHRSDRIGRIVIDPDDSDRIFVAASGNLFRPGGERGLYRSVDGGDTWDLVLAGENATTGAVDIAIDPSDPQRVFAVMWDHLREPDLRRYGGPGSGVFFSDDGGDTWARVAGGLPASGDMVGRIGIAIAPSSPDMMYAIVIDTLGDFDGFFVSTNGGTAWTRLPDASQTVLATTQSTFGWWFGRLWVDPLDPLHVFGAGVQLAESANGGLAWAVQATMHADQHAMAWDASVPGRVYLGNDGGTYRSESNGTGAWTKATYEPYTQFYSVDVSQMDATRVVGGAQDNGSLRSYPTDWNSHGGGDGEENIINPVDQNRVYFCSQYGSCQRSTTGGDSASGFGATTSQRRNWFTPVVFDPNDPAIMYYGGNILNRSTDHAATFTAISPDLTGGPGRDTRYPFGTITTIGVARTDPNRIYVGTDDGKLWVTEDLGANWTELEDNDIPGTWVTRVIVDPTDEDTAYATFSGFREGNNMPHVARTTDGGATWNDISGNLPRAPVNGIILSGSRLYVATDVAVFTSSNGGQSWVRLGSGLPLIPITDIRFHEASNTLFAATFGRGIWKLELPS